MIKISKDEKKVKTEKVDQLVFLSVILVSGGGGARYGHMGCGDTTTLDLR